MKRKVLCVFSFLLILLVFCTLVSPKVEEEMRTLVEARHAEGSKIKSNRNIVVGNVAITWEHSNDILFSIVEGDGWESGLRIAEIPPAYFTRHEAHVEMGKGTDYWYIYSASREPVSGQAVTVVEASSKGDDIYLLWHPEVLENLEKLPNSMTVEQKSDTAALVDMRKGSFPFFEHRVWYSLRDDLGEELRIYSMTDVRQFLDALPWIVSVIAAAFCSIILWGASWILSDKIGCRKRTLVINTLLIVGLLSVLPLLLSQFDLPASLMPQKSILDIPHYLETFGRITTSMDSMGDPTVQNWISQAATTCWAVAGLSVAVTGVIVTVEGILCHRCSKGELEKSEH